jgi:hypothetical protein
MTRAQMMALLSRMNPDDVEMIRQILFEQDLEQDAGMAEIQEIGFDIARTRITNREHFENTRTEIFQQPDGRIARIQDVNVWDCGHSQFHNEFGGIDAFGHVVCKNCLRWCDRGKHPCCVLDSVVFENGERACDKHRGFLWFFRKPTFKRGISI